MAVVSLMVLVVFSLYLYKRTIFYISDSTNTLNADYIYIKANGRLDKIKETYTNAAEVILDIEYIKTDSERVRADVFPYHEDENFKLQGERPIKEGIVVNQLSDLKIDDMVTLEIKNGTETYDYQTKVVGIVDESDALSAAIYYDLDGILADLETVKVADSDLATLISEYPSRFEARVGYERRRLSKHLRTAL